MIHNVTFAGREECLGAPVKKLANKTHEYVAASSYLGEAIPNATKNVNKSAEQINEAFRANYAPYIEPPKAETSEFVSGGIYGF